MSKVRIVRLTDSQHDAILSAVSLATLRWADGDPEQRHRVTVLLSAWSAIRDAPTISPADVAAIDRAAAMLAVRDNGRPGISTIANRVADVVERIRRLG